MLKLRRQQQVTPKSAKKEYTVNQSSATLLHLEEQTNRKMAIHVLREQDVKKLSSHDIYRQLLIKIIWKK